MASRRLVPTSVREALLGIPCDIASLERNYLLADDDLDLIGTRRRPENRLGLALHIALLRHPGQGWHDDTEPSAPLVAWLAGQIEVPFPSLARYGSRGATRSNHRRLAVRHLGLRAFVPAHDMRTAMDLAARAGGGREAALDFAHFANGDGTTSDLVFVNLSTEASRAAPTPFHTAFGKLQHIHDRPCENRGWGPVPAALQSFDKGG